jgi:hypothetical protein
VLHPELPRLSLWVALCALLCLWPSQVLRAQPAGDSTDAQVQVTIAEAVNLTHPELADAPVNIRRRHDLEVELAEITRAVMGKVLFYDVESPGRPAAGNDSLWAVVPSGPEAESYRLYSFDSSEGFDEASREFNRLMSQLNFSIPGGRADELARFFLKCCVRGEPGEVVADENALQHAVERYYLAVFGDGARTLEASSRWWQAYEASSAVPPSVAGEAAGNRIEVKRLLLIFGMHPELQQWDVEVSGDGAVRVLAWESIFPKRGPYVFYDFRTTLKSFGSTLEPGHVSPVPR